MNDDTPIPFPDVTAQPPCNIVDYVSDLQTIVGLSIAGLVPTETPDGKAMVLGFSSDFGRAGGFDVGIALSGGSVIDLGDDVTDAASHHEAMQSIIGATVTGVDTIADSIEGVDLKVLRIVLETGRQIKIGGPGGMVVATPAQEGPAT